MTSRLIRALALVAIAAFTLLGSGHTARAQIACTVRPDWNSQYSVGAGDNLSRIAQVFGLTTQELAAGNCIANPNLVYAGQILQVPASNGVRRIAFQVFAVTSTVQSQLAAAGMDQWVLGVQAGQTLTVQLATNGGKNILIAYGADGNVLLSDHAEATQFSVVVPTTQDYRIDVRGDVSAPTAYTMAVTIPPLPLPANVAPVIQRIAFVPGTAGANLTGMISATGAADFVLRVLAGQTLVAQVGLSTGYGALIVYGVDGTVLQSAGAGSYYFSRVVPTSQDYIITVRGNGVSVASYALSVYVPPLQ